MKQGFYLIIILLFIACQKESPKNTAPTEIEKQVDFVQFPALDYDSLFQKKSFHSEEIRKNIKDIQHFYRNYWELNKVSGGILVAKNGNLLFEKYSGYANTETKDTLSANTPLHIASVSKVLTALALLKLVEKDSIRLTQNIDEFFPGFPYEIKVQDLLNHRSGLPNYAYFPHDSVYWNTYEVKSNLDIVEALKGKNIEPYSRPNEHFSYSNTNYALLALIIEKKTGCTFPEAMKKMLFEPLKMNHTFVFNLKDSARVSQSYSHRGTRWDFNFLDNIYGDKNVYSTPRDLFKLDKALYSGQFLSPKIQALMKQGYSYETKGMKNYGLGIRILGENEKKPILFHNGWWHGNYATYVRGEKDSVAIIALGNKQIRSVYSAFSLISIFGDYPVSLDFKETSAQNKSSDTAIENDSIQPKNKNI